MVERLATGFQEWSEAREDVWDDEDAARWWLNAVAGELVDAANGMASGFMRVALTKGADYLRAQAKEADEDPS